MGRLRLWSQAASVQILPLPFTGLNLSFFTCRAGSRMALSSPKAARPAQVESELSTCQPGLVWVPSPTWGHWYWSLTGTFGCPNSPCRPPGAPGFRKTYVEISE